MNGDTNLGIEAMENIISELERINWELFKSRLTIFALLVLHGGEVKIEGSHYEEGLKFTSFDCEETDDGGMVIKLIK